MVITSPSVKAGIVAAFVILAPMVGVALLVVDVFWGYAWTLVTMTALVVFSARVFRMPEEVGTPRPWWQMTSVPFTSGLLSVTFMAQTAYVFFGSWSPPLVVPARISSGVLLVITLAYAHSAIRLARRRVAPAAVPTYSSAGMR